MTTIDREEIRVAFGENNVDRLEAMRSNLTHDQFLVLVQHILAVQGLQPMARPDIMAQLPPYDVDDEKSWWRGYTHSGFSNNAAVLDHRVPVHQGGSDEMENLQWISARAKVTKADLSDEQFLGFLQHIAHYYSLAPMLRFEAMADFPPVELKRPRGLEAQAETKVNSEPHCITEVGMIRLSSVLKFAEEIENGVATCACCDKPLPDTEHTAFKAFVPAEGDDHEGHAANVAEILTAWSEQNGCCSCCGTDESQDFWVITTACNQGCVTVIGVCCDDCVDGEMDCAAGLDEPDGLTEATG